MSFLDIKPPLINFGIDYKHIPWEISILSYCRIFIIHTKIHQGKFEDSIYHRLQ